MAFQCPDHIGSIRSAGTLNRFLVLVHNTVGRGRRGRGAHFIAGREGFNKLLAAGVVVLVRQGPYPGCAANHTFHHRRAHLPGHAQSQVGNHHLHALGQTHFIGHLQRAHHVVAKQYHHQHLGVRFGSLFQGLAEVGNQCPGKRGFDARVAFGVLGIGKLANGLFH